MTTGPVLVTGAHGPAGRALMAQFDERGLPVLGVDMAVDDSSPRVLRVPPAKDPTYPDALRSVIEANGVEVLIPTVSEELRLVAGLRGGFWDGIRVVISPGDAVRVADDKLLTARCLAAAGVATPPFAGGEEFTSGPGVAERIGFPLVIKPRVSRGARGVRVAHSAGEVGEVAGSCIVQGFVPGTEYAPVVYAALPGGSFSRSGKPLDPFVAVLEKTGLTAGEVGNATGVKRVDGPGVADVARLAVRTVQAIGLVGPVDIDIRRDATGTPRVLEVNARFGANSRAVPELLGLLLRDLDPGDP